MSAESDLMVLAQHSARQKSPTGSWSGTDGKGERNVGGVKIMILGLILCTKESKHDGCLGGSAEALTIYGLRFN